MESAAGARHRPADLETALVLAGLGNFGAGAVLSSAITQLGLIGAAQLALRHDLTVFELQALMAAATLTALLVGVLVDERARAAAELRSSLRFAAAGHMAAALAHELSQPLTALNNYAHACRTLAGASVHLDGPQREQLSEIMERIAAEAPRALVGSRTRSRSLGYAARPADCRRLAGRLSR